MRCHLGQVIEYSDGARIPSAVHYSVSPLDWSYFLALRYSQRQGEKKEKKEEDRGGPRKTIVTEKRRK